MHNMKIQYINRVAFTEAHQGDFASNFLQGDSDKIQCSYST